MKKVLCMGGVTMDMMMRLPHFPAPGETVVTDNFVCNPGGKGSNQAATLAKLGASPRYFTKLGGDPYSQSLTEQLSADGIDMSAVIRDPALQAGIALVLVDAGGQNSCAFFPGSCLEVTPEEVRENRHIFEGCGILLISMEMRQPAVYEAIRLAHEAGLTIVMDPSPVPEGGIPPEIARMVDFVKPNELEARTLTGIEIKTPEDGQAALHKLEALGFKHPIISLGDRGCMLRVEGEVCQVPPRKVQSVDTTAAGDVFLGSFTYALALGKSIKSCVEFASHAAALSTTKSGAQSSIPTLDEIQRFMEGA